MRAAVQRAAWKRSGHEPWREDYMGAKPLDVQVNALSPNAAAYLFHERMLELRHGRTGLVPPITANPWPWRVDAPEDLWFDERP